MVKTALHRSGSRAPLSGSIRITESSPRGIRFLMCLVALLVATALLLLPLAMAVPVLPRADVPAGDVQSLAGIDAVRVEVELHAPALDTDQDKLKMLESTFRVLIEDQPIRVTPEDDEAPLMRLAMQTQTADDVPDAVAVIYHISVTQPVTVERINKQVSLPTYSLIHTVVMPENRLRDRLDEPLRAMVNRLVEEIGRATEMED